MQPSEYTDDHFEGMFYNSLREESSLRDFFSDLGSGDEKDK